MPIHFENPAARSYKIELTRDGDAFQVVAFRGTKHNARNAARKLAFQNGCGYRILLDRGADNG